MKKNVFLVAMLGLVLAFGTTVISCGDKGSGDPTSPSSGDDTGDDTIAPDVPFTGTELGLYIGNATSPQTNTGTLTLALAWLKANAADNTVYTILIGADESLPATTLGGGSTESVAARKTNVKIIIKGKDTERKVRLYRSGSLFTIDSGITLVLDENITLVGISYNDSPLVQITSASLEMWENARITGNTSPYGAVHVKSSSTFIMNGSASVSGNIGTVISLGDGAYMLTGGGGVSVAGGTFIMNDATTVSNNTAFSGGGVYNGGTFTMNDGATVSGNTTTVPLSLSSSSSYSYGGGVYNGGTFTMNDSATVSGNTASSSSGGGVYNNGGTFTMNDSTTVSGNTASTRGGGVYNGGTFTMNNNASVSDNVVGSSSVSSTRGGGVYNGGTFTMNNRALVSGNTAYSSNTSYGGGVSNAGTFTMNGGTVYGSDGGASANKLEGSQSYGISLCKDLSATAPTAEYGNSTPIIAEGQWYSDYTLTGHN
ncbi:hypothetical protein FACS189444_5420 [Spirochaetia bacterium]|nr:hypothetical protein FACS189444_5420 [Spirochaetia bacterium]